MVPIIFYPLFFELPAVVFLLVWLFMQISGGASAAVSGQQVSNVAFWAHIGGLASGVALGKLFARYSKSTPRAYRSGFYRR
jgi:membrane associated rhomboid family serine protease